MRRFALPMILTLLAACESDSRPVYGSGVWRFHDLVTNTCFEDERERSVTGEHGDESPGGGVIIARCRASERSSGDLSLNLRLEDTHAADLVDIRGLIIPAAYLSAPSPIDAVPTGCESVHFEVSGAHYSARCTTGEPEEGDCQLLGARLDRSSSSVSVEFSCHAVPTLGGGASTCEVSGGGTSTIATLTFDGCEGF